MKVKIGVLGALPIIVGLLFASATPGRCFVSNPPQILEWGSINGTWTNCNGQPTPDTISYSTTGPH